MHRVTTRAAIAALTAAASLSHADILSISGGGIIHADPPVDFPLPNKVENVVLQGINEKQRLSPDDPDDPIDISVIDGLVNWGARDPGTTLSSHLIAFDPRDRTNIGPTEVRFDGEIVAVISDDQGLADSHAVFGLDELNYPVLTEYYGIDPERESLSWAGDTLFFEGRARSPGDYVRVLTANAPVPAPGAGLCLAAGLAAANRRSRTHA